MVTDELRQLYQKGRLLPFIGAGVSSSVRWDYDGKEIQGPSWKELVDEAARHLGFEPDLLRVRGTDLQILEFYHLRERTLQPLTNWLIRRMTPSDEALRASPIHGELSKMQACTLFYTTNFDNFIERSFALHGRQCRVVAIEAHMARPAASCDVVKFHGDWDHPEEMVLSEAQYEKRLELSSLMDIRLRADMLGRAVLFLGYSFRDQNVAYLFRRLTDQFRGLPATAYGRRAYITVPDPSAFEISLFRERNIEVLPIARDTMTQEIADLLRIIRGD